MGHRNGRANGHPTRGRRFHAFGTMAEPYDMPHHWSDRWYRSREGALVSIRMHTRLIALIVALAAIVAACSSGEGTGGQLDGTKWVLRSYLQGGSLLLVPDTEYADAEFDAGRVSGFGGCNRFTAAYRSGGRTLFISEAANTLMACAESSISFESTYLDLLQQSRFYSARNNTLTIIGENTTTLLVFDAAPENPLLGRWTVDSFSDAPGSLVAVLPDTELDVLFGIGNVGGSSGCNTFAGTYGTNGNVVRVGALATTQKACPDAVMTQETAFLAALQGAALIDARTSTANLTDLSGNILVALVRPVEAEAGSAAPSAISEPTEEPTEKPTDKPTPKPTEKPTPTPSPTPSPTPTATPGPTSTAATVSTCQLKSAVGVKVAKITYPATWSTVTTPADLACQYFDPEPITVPADPSTLVTTIMASSSGTAYDDAVEAATDESSWTVTQEQELELDGLDATLVAATATTDAAGIPTGTSRFAYFVDVGSSGTVTLWTTGAANTLDYAQATAILGLMVEQSKFFAGS